MSAPRSPDPWAGASSAAVLDLLRARGIEAHLGPEGPQVDLGATGLCLLTSHGPEGAKSLDALCGQHGALPGAPRWLDAAGRRCALYRAPPGLRGDAINLHGTAPGVSLAARGVVLLPPCAPVGSIELRWSPRDHPASTPIKPLPLWLAAVAADPLAAQRAWDTAGKGPEAKAELDAWQKNLVWERGKIARTHGNLCKILRGAPEWSGRLAFDEMARAPCLDGDALTDPRVDALRERIEDTLGVAFSTEALWSAAGVVAAERRFHPVREYLRARVWDGTSRIDLVAPAILGAKTPLEALFVRRWLISAAARALRPGCKCDTALVLVGKQAALKSTFFATLAGAWFCDTASDITDKDAFLQLASAWVIEWAEFERVTSRRGADEIKAFLSSREDRYRPPYGRAQITVPRACVIVGSTNQSTFLDDETGSRRFWPVAVADVIDIETLTAWRDQVWAEAVALLDSGERWWLDKGEDAERHEAAAQYAVEDPWAVAVSRWVLAQGRSDHTAGEILAGALDVPRKDHTKAASMRVGKVMRALGWERVNRRPTREGKVGDLTWLWVDPDASLDATSLDDFDAA